MQPARARGSIASPRLVYASLEAGAGSAAPRVAAPPTRQQTNGAERGKGE